MDNPTLPYSITPLPSGFYAVWVGGEWVSASHKTREDAVSFAEKFVRKVTK